ncbi:MAG TPA: hypothetical protein PK299_01495 [Anaerolineales bacterium]|nr:hypothetical protein [Anaerolineales bacterium]
MRNYFSPHTIIATLIGALLACSYAVVGTYINRFIAPDLPLIITQNWTDIIITTLFGACIGYLSSLPKSFMIGVLSSALVITLFLYVKGVLNAASTGQAGVLLVARLLVFLPSLIFALPITLFLRWVTDWYVHNYYYALPNQRITVGFIWVGFLIGGIVLGTLNGISQEEEQAVRQINQLILRANAATTPADVPEALMKTGVYPMNPAATYQLTWGSQTSNEVIDGYSAGVKSFVVTAIYSNGIIIQCTPGTTMSQTFCSKLQIPTP